MDRLWAPWRISYIAKKKQKKCIFCQGAKAKAPRQVFLSTRHSLAMLNIYPYNNGHVMVSCKRHTQDIGSLSQEELLDLGNTVVLTKKILDKTLKPHGFNIGMNLSSVAGAGIVGHLHVHLVPRWKGDTNFMPVLAGTKIISQSLEELHARLIKTATNLCSHARSKSNKKIRR